MAFSYEGEPESLLSSGNEIQLRRMLLGLISNAIRAAGEQGQAGLRMAVHGKRVCFTVWDNGRGMDFAQREIKDLLKREEGLGLGLRVARRIAALHGGTLVFEQQEDRGSRAIVSLPIRPAQESGMLRTPGMPVDMTGGFSDVMLELADVLPYQVFCRENLE